jgi:hypothetical protein
VAVLSFLLGGNGRQVTKWFFSGTRLSRGQLTSRKTMFDSRGRIKLKSKEDMRARGLRSPDRADAVAGVFGVGSGFANSLNRRFMPAPSDDPMAALNAYCDGQRVGASDPYCFTR